MEYTPFELNCRRSEYNAEYNRLSHLIMSGLISPQEYTGQLNQLREKYPELFEVPYSEKFTTAN